MQGPKAIQGGRMTLKTGKIQKGPKSQKKNGNRKRNTVKNQCTHENSPGSGLMGIRERGILEKNSRTHDGTRTQIPYEQGNYQVRSKSPRPTGPPRHGWEGYTEFSTFRTKKVRRTLQSELQQNPHKRVFMNTREKRRQRKGANVGRES